MMKPKRRKIKVTKKQVLQALREVLCSIAVAASKYGVTEEEFIFCACTIGYKVISRKKNESD